MLEIIELKPFEPITGWLVDGEIPAHSMCPFRVICNKAKQGLCPHQSYEHKIDFSCANARSLQIIINQTSTRSPEGFSGGVRQG